MPKAPSCANPVFYDILDEWREEIREKNPDNKVVQVIGKAMKSLKEHPTRIDTPRDCQPLSFFGVWIIKGLTERYARLQNGAGAGGSSAAGSSPPRPKAKAKSKASSSRTVAPPSSSPSPPPAPPKAKRGRPAGSGSKTKASSSASSTATRPTSSTARTASSSTGRSRIEVTGEDRNIVIIPRAQPRAAAPPRRQDLGWDPYAVDAPSVRDAGASVSRTSSSSGNGARDMVERAIRPSQPQSHPTEKEASVEGRRKEKEFMFWYIDTDGSRVTHRDQAEIVIQSNALFYRVEYPDTESSHPIARGLKGSMRKEDGGETFVGLMSEDVSEGREGSTGSMGAAGGAASSSRTASAPSGSSSFHVESAHQAHSSQPSSSRPIPTGTITSASIRTNSLSTASASASASVSSTAFSRTKSAPLPRPIPESEIPFQPLRRANESAAATAKRNERMGRRPRVSEHIRPPEAIDQELERMLDHPNSPSPSPSNSSLRSTQTLPFEPTILPADSYEIIFILDSREIKSRKNREYIDEQLRKRGVKVEKRALELGDMLWIARLRNGPAEEESEVVLDFIVERKRMDDLVGSIKDGRFHEQKFRLKQSGLGRVYYLVEEYGDNVVHKHMEKGVFTALSSTQIVDGIFLKETRDIEDTIEFVAGLHGTICKEYQGKDIHIIPSSQIHRHSHLALIKQLASLSPETPYHTSYSAFRELNKSGSVTLKDVFARMLLCIRGMSSEKVATVIEHYDTPRRLWDAFRDAEVLEAEERAAEEREEEENGGGKAKGKGRKKKSQVVPARLMLTRLPANGRRQIKGALAEQIYDLFMMEHY